MIPKYLVEYYDKDENFLQSLVAPKINWTKYSTFFKERVDGLEIGESASEHYTTILRLS
jgi:hypothetical protein